VSRRISWRPIAIWLLFSLLVLVPQMKAGAQQRRATLALVRALPDSIATAQIVREAGPNGRTLIYMREDNADAATLASALSSLDNSLRKYGDAPDKEFVITLRGKRSAKSLSEAERRLTSNYVARLRRAGIEQLPNFGSARTVVISLDSLPR
jgi:hypothetical protein